MISELDKSVINGDFASTASLIESQASFKAISEKDLQALLNDFKGESLNLGELLDKNGYSRIIHNIQFDLPSNLKNVDLSGLSLKGCEIYNLHTCQNINLDKTDFSYVKIFDGFIDSEKLQNTKTAKFQGALIVSDDNIAKILSPEQYNESSILETEKDLFFAQASLISKFKNFFVKDHLNEIGLCTGMTFDRTIRILENKLEDKAYVEGLKNLMERPLEDAKKHLKRIHSYAVRIKTTSRFTETNLSTLPNVPAFRDYIKKLQTKYFLKFEEAQINNINFIDKLLSSCPEARVIGIGVGSEEGGHQFSLEVRRDKNDPSKIIGFKIHDPNFYESKLLNKEQVEHQLKSLMRFYKNRYGPEAQLYIDDLGEIVSALGLFSANKDNKKEIKSDGSQSKAIKNKDIHHLYNAIEKGNTEKVKQYIKAYQHIIHINDATKANLRPQTGKLLDFTLEVKPSCEIFELVINEFSDITISDKTSFICISAPNYLPSLKKVAIEKSYFNTIDKIIEKSPASIKKEDFITAIKHAVKTGAIEKDKESNLKIIEKHRDKFTLSKEDISKLLKPSTNEDQNPQMSTNELLTKDKSKNMKNSMRIERIPVVEREQNVVAVLKLLESEQLLNVRKKHPIIQNMIVIIENTDTNDSKNILNNLSQIKELIKKEELSKMASPTKEILEIFDMDNATNFRFIREKLEEVSEPELNFKEIMNTVQVLPNTQELTHIEQEVVSNFNRLLNELEKKVTNLNVRKERAKAEGKTKRYDALNSACSEAEILYKSLSTESEKYFANPTQASYKEFQDKSEKAIKLARPTLEKHRGWTELLGNIGLAILGAGVLYLIAIGINRIATERNYLFFKTQSEQIIDDIEKQVNLASPKT